MASLHWTLRARQVRRRDARPSRELAYRLRELPQANGDGGAGMLRRSLLVGTAAAAGVSLLPIGAALADTLEEVKKRGTLTVGTEAAYVPYEFVKDGQIIGYDPDIIAIMVKNLGVKADIIDTAWAGIIPSLYANKFDCIISAMTMTKERAEKVLFSMPYAEATNVILLRADEERIKTADDLSGKIIGVQLGSAAAGIIKVFE
jgi:polar amino acid transport system substrate-binding protein